MKAILIQKNGELKLDLRSGENQKTLIQNKDVSKKLEKLSSFLGFKDKNAMLDQASKGDESIFDFERVYDSGHDFSFEDLDKYLKDLEIDSNLHDELKEELKKNYISDLAASSIDCIFENFVYQIIEQMKQLMIDELEIEIDSFNDGNFDRMLEIAGMNMGLAEIKLSGLERFGENND